MKRDPRLQGLSSDHHHALVFARRLAEAVAAGRADPATAREAGAQFFGAIDPHFQIEERSLLPALREVGALALVERTEADHASLRALASSAQAGACEGLDRFAALLTEHIRFEERELFPCCETRLPSAVLDTVAAAAPHPRAKPRRE